MPNTQGGTLDKLLERDLRPQVRRAVEIVRLIGKTSIKKYRRMLEVADADDDRIRGCFMYHGAGPGRWTGSLVQLQNFPRGEKNDQEQLWDVIRRGDLELLSLLWEPMKTLSHALRGALIAAPGLRFACADFSQIEARVLDWLSGETAGLDAFRAYDAGTGPDVYLVMASMIYNRVIQKSDELERFLGKQAKLALGFGAGFVKFLIHCRNLGAPPFSQEQIAALVPPADRDRLRSWIQNSGWEMVKRLIDSPTKQDVEELVLTKHIVDKYRKRHAGSVVKFWRDLEDAVRWAIQSPGKRYRVGKLVWHVEKIGRVFFLRCLLPSGRFINYPEPELSEGGEISYMGVDDRNQWSREKTYGGKLAENATQGVARDFMAEAMLRLERHKRYERIVMTVHDEVVAESPDPDLKEFLQIVSEVPAWGAGCPIKAEGWIGKRYRK